ncbi:multisubunit potassium/proton antiporter PhaE subunit [Paucimonas lemoignei]|uniref:Multisubunit potassium/proton antiporter PhaE subunit n=1 Tax=Paucimonas lemoignei TaxID=29443 RepID=A0A4R3HVG2_PAULE|nr:Na+/H+ antiporter subunit E [Paucimonas lemoignei]TCS36533.1 multisubunit potassium/proton antiporter PhaE subunit [Paucimonas lemoignei]
MKHAAEPRLAAILLALWLLLNDSFSAGHALLGLVLAIGLPLLTASMRPLRGRARRPLAILMLMRTVFKDILRSNIAVASVILGNTERRSYAGFMDIPLDLRDPHGLAALACIITATPGTVWAGLSPDGSTLRLHVLDLQDEQEWIDTIKLHYERPLMEIFE